VNEHEVEKVTKLVLALLILGEQPGDITVLSPYRAQVHAVTRGLRNCRDLTLDPNIIAKSILVKVCTVDEYQVLSDGRQKNVCSSVWMKLLCPLVLRVMRMT
jgi:superfamily I DNA and/or RNA helicase